MVGVPKSGHNEYYTCVKTTCMQFPYFYAKNKFRSAKREVKRISWVELLDIKVHN